MFNLYWADERGLPAGDRGCAYGDGLFETIRMQGNRGVLMSRHLNRMAGDADRLGIPITVAELRKACSAAADRFAGRFSNAGGGGAWVLKLILTRGEGGRGYRPGSDVRPNLLVTASSMPSLPPLEGVEADFSRIPLTVNPLFSGIKSLNRLEQVMAARELEEGVFEVIMADADGNLVEGTRTNLLVKTPDGWATPPTKSLAVAGVLRQWLLERLRARGETVVERPLSVQDLTGPGCSGVYLMNSVLGVVSVRRLADQDLPVDGGLATIFKPLELLE